MVCSYFDMATLAGIQMEWITSQKGNQQLVVDSFDFVANGKGTEPTV